MCVHTPTQLRTVADLLSRDDSLRREEDNDKNWPLHSACKNGHLETVEEILKHDLALLTDRSCL